MAVLIKDILALDVFKDAKILAGLDGFSNIVTNVTIADAPTSDLDYQLSKAGDFYISSFHFADKSLEKMFSFVNTLIDTGASGLCLTDDSISTLPKEICVYCSEKKLPVMMVSATIPYSNLIKEISKLIFLEQQDLAMERKINILIEKKIDEESKSKIINSINPHFLNLVSAIYILPQVKAANLLHFHIPDVIKNNVNNLVIKYKYGILALLSYDDKDEAIIEKKVIDYINIAFSTYIGRSGFVVGVSNHNCRLLDCDIVINQAIAASQFEQKGVSLDTNIIVYYKNLGLFKLLLPFKGRTELNVFCHEILDPIIDYDMRRDGHLFKTMSCFVKNERDYKVTSKRLYVHENTVRYRINKAIELISTHNPGEDACELFSIALKIHQMNNLPLFNI